MTDETKAKIEREAYADYRAEAVKRLTMMGVPDVKDDFESMMNAVDYVKCHANRKGEFSGAMFASAMWVHGWLEQDTAKRLKEVEAMFAADKGADGSAAK